MSTRHPGWIVLRSRKRKANQDPYISAAASSYVTVSGFKIIMLSSGTHLYSAYVPERVCQSDLTVNPHTGSPGRKRVTAVPTASTSPAYTRPRMGLRGLDKPTASR